MTGNNILIEKSKFVMVTEDIAKSVLGISKAIRMPTTGQHSYTHIRYRL